MELTNEQKDYLVETVKKIPFFERCGIKEELNLPFESAQIENWKIAYNYYTSFWWENVGIEGLNKLSAYLHDKYPKLYFGVWNNYVEKIEQILYPLIEDKICSYMKNNVDDNFEDRNNLWACASSAIRRFAMEYIYKAQRPPTTFFTDLVEGVYMNGHFPCGWDAGLPDDVFADPLYEIPWKGKYPAIGKLIYI